MKSNCFDILVIGAGIAGASAAAELAQHARVGLLEAEEQPAYHATGRSAAYFAKFYGNETVRSLTKAAGSFFLDPPHEFTEVPLFNPRDCILVARGDQRKILADTREEMPSQLTKLSRNDVYKLVPIFSPNYVFGALLAKGGGDLDVHAIMQGYLRLFRKRRGMLKKSARVERLERVNQSWQITTEEESYMAPVIVNAGGAWADEIAELARLEPLGLTPMRRTGILIDVPHSIDVSAWPLVVDIEEKFYFKPEAGKLFVSPADETPSPPCDAQAEELDVAIAVDRFERATGINVKRVNHKWAGLRTFAIDSTPVVGFDPRTEGFFWLAGQGGYGVQTAPTLARLTEYLILGNESSSVISSLIPLIQKIDPGRLVTNRIE